MDITYNSTVNPKDPQQWYEMSEHFAKKHTYREEQLEAATTDFEALQANRVNLMISGKDDELTEGVHACNAATASMWSEATKHLSTKAKENIFHMYCRCCNFKCSVKIMESVLKEMVTLA